MPPKKGSQSPKHGARGRSPKRSKSGKSSGSGKKVRIIIYRRFLDRWSMIATYLYRPLHKVYLGIKALRPSRPLWTRRPSACKKRKMLQRKPWSAMHNSTYSQIHSGSANGTSAKSRGSNRRSYWNPSIAKVAIDSHPRTSFLSSSIRHTSKKDPTRRIRPSNKTSRSSSSQATPPRALSFHQRVVSTVPTHSESGSLFSDPTWRRRPRRPTWSSRCPRRKRSRTVSWTNTTITSSLVSTFSRQW